MDSQVAVPRSRERTTETDCAIEFTFQSHRDRPPGKAASTSPFYWAGTPWRNRMRTTYIASSSGPRNLLRSTSLHTSFLWIEARTWPRRHDRTARSRPALRAYRDRTRSGATPLTPTADDRRRKQSKRAVLSSGCTQSRDRLDAGAPSRLGQCGRQPVARHPAGRRSMAGVSDHHPTAKPDHLGISGPRRFRCRHPAIQRSRTVRRGRYGSGEPPPGSSPATPGENGPSAPRRMDRPASGPSGRVRHHRGAYSSRR